MKRLALNFIKLLARPLVRFLIKKTKGRVLYQKYYELLHQMAISGMNYGSGDFRQSGELALLEQIAKGRFASPGDSPIIFDVGSNVGDYAIEINRSLADRKPRVFCFEPSAETFEALNKNLQAHSIPATVGNFGFSDKKKTVKLYSYSDHSLLSSVYKRDLDNYTGYEGRVEEIEVRTIDDYCKENEISEIFFLKIDIEGEELNALRGAAEMIRNRRIQMIQFEFGEAQIDSRTFLRDFYEILHEYDFYRIVRDGLSPLDTYSEANEVFKTINFFAKLK